MYPGVGQEQPKTEGQSPPEGKDASVEQSPKQMFTTQTGNTFQAPQEGAVKLGPYMTSYRDIHKNVQAFFKTVVANMITHGKTKWKESKSEAAEKEYKTYERVLKDIKKAVPYIRFEPQKVLTLQFLASLTEDIGSEPDEDVLDDILYRAASPEQGEKLRFPNNNGCKGKQTDVVEQYIELLEYFEGAKKTIYDDRIKKLRNETTTEDDGGDQDDM